MPLTRLEKPQWPQYFDRLSAALGAKQVEVDIVGPSTGAQPQARRLSLTGSFPRW